MLLVALQTGRGMGILGEIYFSEIFTKSVLLEILLVKDLRKVLRSEKSTKKY